MYGTPRACFLDDAMSKRTLRCYWICSFSNNQWKVDEAAPGRRAALSFLLAASETRCVGKYVVRQEIGDTWDESSFYLAMRSNECLAPQRLNRDFDNERK